MGSRNDHDDATAYRSAEPRRRRPCTIACFLRGHGLGRTTRKQRPSGVLRARMVLVVAVPARAPGGTVEDFAGGRRVPGLLLFAQRENAGRGRRHSGAGEGTRRLRGAGAGGWTRAANRLYG